MFISRMSSNNLGSALSTSIANESILKKSLSRHGSPNKRIRDDESESIGLPSVSKTPILKNKYSHNPRKSITQEVIPNHTRNKTIVPVPKVICNDPYVTEELLHHSKPPIPMYSFQSSFRSSYCDTVSELVKRRRIEQKVYQKFFK